MKIPSNLEQFNRKAIVVVTGIETARIYKADHGTIERVLSLKITKPAYSDREGFYGQHGKAKSGSVMKPVIRSIRLDFKHALTPSLATITKDPAVKQIIFFTPKRYRSETMHLLPKPAEKKITLVVSGNFFKEQPLELVKKITRAKAVKKIKLPTHL